MDAYLPALREYVTGLDGLPVSVSAAAELLGVERTLARKLLRHIKALPVRPTDAMAVEFLRPIAAEQGRRFPLNAVLERA